MQAKLYSGRSTSLAKQRRSSRRFSESIRCQLPRSRAFQKIIAGVGLKATQDRDAGAQTFRQGSSQSPQIAPGNGGLSDVGTYVALDSAKLPQTLRPPLRRVTASHRALPPSLLPSNCIVLLHLTLLPPTCCPPLALRCVTLRTRSSPSRPASALPPPGRAYRRDLQ